MAFDHCLKNGEILMMQQAHVSIGNIEYAYGFGVYETIRVVHGAPVFLKQHLDRLFLSAGIIGLTHALTEGTIHTWIGALIQATKADTCNLKILLIGGRTAEDATLWILPLTPLFPDKKLYRDGVATITVSHERFLPHAKTLNMLPSYLFYGKAKEAGCYDALLMDRHGNLTEGTRTNLLAIKDRTILSPPTHDILEGVMRANVLNVATKHGFDMREEILPLSHVDSYDGFFLTSTSSKILPIRKIDDHELSIPEALRELMRSFDAFLLFS